ncbi:MAG: DICT sensory domain-containing protein [Spirulinaceae cyanobacterium]
MLQGSILEKLKTAHHGGERPLNLGVYYKNTLVALCHALEDFILESDSSPIMITAFQQGKWYLQEAERYRELADQSSQVVIMAAPNAGFADHPTSKKDNVNLVNLNTDDPVAQEWHLMIMSPQYTAMVLCQELSEEDYGASRQPKEDLERKFYGFWTFEPELVKETIDISLAHIDKYDHKLATQLTAKAEGIAAKFGEDPHDDLGKVVSRVVTYLQTSQEQLEEPLSQAVSADLDTNLLSNEMQAFLRMAQLINPSNQPIAAAEVSALAENMGQMLDLPAWQIKRLRLAGLLHGIVPGLMTKVASEDEAPSCPLVPEVQALRIMPQLQAVAQIITHQHERWDGEGAPAGLAYDNIPLESRILALVREFRDQIAQLSQQKDNLSQEEALSQALANCQSKAGEVFDPKLVEGLSLLVMGMQQGMSIQASQPKIAAGMWLLDADAAEKIQYV